MAMADESRKLVRNIIVKGFDQHARDGDIYGSMEDQQRTTARDWMLPSVVMMTRRNYLLRTLYVTDLYLAVTKTC